MATSAAFQITYYSVKLNSFLHHSTTTSGRVIVCVDFEFISVHKVDVGFSFPCVGHSGDWDQLNGLTLKKRPNVRVFTLNAIYFFSEIFRDTSYYLTDENNNI